MDFKLHQLSGSNLTSIFNNAYIEAEKVKEELSDLFPTSFIVAEKINLPRLEREKKDQ